MKKKFFILACLVSFAFANTMQEIKSSKTIRIGVYRDSPPFSQLIDGKFVGFEVDLANKLAGAIFGSGGGNVEFVIIPSGKDRIPMVQENKIDMAVATLTVTPGRKELVDFTLPYFRTTLAVLTRKGEIRALSDFRNLNKSIIAKTGTTIEEYFTKFHNDIKRVACESNQDCYDKLKAGEGDGWSSDNIGVLAYSSIDDQLEVNITNLGDIEFLAIAVQKGNNELLNFINDEMIKLSKNGFFKDAFDNKFVPFYKGKAERKYFLLDDFYSALFY